MYSKYLHKLTYPNSFAKARSRGIYSKALSILIVFYKHCMPNDPQQRAYGVRHGEQYSIISIQRIRALDRARCIERNLKAIDISIPKKRLVVFTGMSGSAGKSSLAFDTIFAGQRRYVKSLSPMRANSSARWRSQNTTRFVDSPTINLEQKTVSKNPRSTVGTITEIHDYMRVLFARLGHQHCHQCGRSVKPQSAEQIVDQLMT